MSKLIPVSIAICLGLHASIAQAFKCYATIMKSDCWKDYNVHITVTDHNTEKPVFETIDPETNQSIAQKIEIPKGQLWTRVEFKCYATQGLIFHATFDPPVWEGHGGKVYNTKRIWFLPKEINKGISAWNMPICFPNNFSGVPILPNVTKLCNCNSVKKQIPALKPE